MRTSRRGVGDRAGVHDERPRARSAELVIEHLEEETLVYDQRSHRAHCLSASAAQVWELCDGRSTADDVARRTGLSRETLAVALEELRSCDLLEGAAQASRDGSTRREVAARAIRAGVAAASVPLIVSVAAPTAAQAVTLRLCQNVGGVSNCGNACCGDPALAGCCCCQSSEQGSQRSCVPASMCPTFYPGFVGNCTCTNAG